MSRFVYVHTYLQVWKRQQAAAAEARKAEELKKQLEEERKQNEYLQLAESAGHLKWVLQ